MHQTHVMESPFIFFRIPFLLQSCDGTVCPDHVSLVLFSQLYPAMMNLYRSVSEVMVHKTRGRIIVRFAAASKETAGNLWPIL